MYSEKEFDGDDEDDYKDSIREELKVSKQEMKAILKIIYTEGSTIKMINKKLEIIHGEINTLLTPSYTAEPDSIEDDFVYKTLEKLGIRMRHSNSHSRAAIKRSRKTRNHKKKSKRRKKESKRRKKKTKRRKK
tara:strand:- start:96 stop:494 length:399 start_codon:yes stop_codon:yes gene_type:complete